MWQKKNEQCVLGAEVWEMRSERQSRPDVSRGCWCDVTITDFLWFSQEPTGGLSRDRWNNPTWRLTGSFWLTCAGSRWGILLMTKVMRKEARHTQRWDRASGVPPDILEHFPPKNQSLPTLLLCALTSDFTGGCPLPPSHLLSVKELTYSSN